MVFQLLNKNKQNDMIDPLDPLVPKAKGSVIKDQLTYEI